MLRINLIIFGGGTSSPRLKLLEIIAITKPQKRFDLKVRSGFFRESSTESSHLWEGNYEVFFRVPSVGS